MRVQSQNDHRLRNREVLFFFKRCGFKDNSNFGDLPRKFESTTHSFYYFVESFHTSAGSLSFSLYWRATTLVHRFKIHFCTSLKCDCVFKQDEHNLDLDCDSLLLPNCMYCMCLLFVCAFNPNTFIFIFCVRLCTCLHLCVLLFVCLLIASAGSGDRPGTCNSSAHFYIALLFSFPKNIYTFVRQYLNII